MITMRAARQGLIPGLIVAAVLVASFFAMPRSGVNSVLTCASYGYLCGTPTVTNVSPNAGSTSGGTTVTITGTNFNNTSVAVHFGATAAISVTVVSDTSITAVSPAHALGTVDVTVTTNAGTSATSSADHFTYFTPCTSVAATTSPVGTAKAGTVILVTAVASGCGSPLYQFFVELPGGSWMIAQPFSARATFNWDTNGPEPAGSYHYSVWVRDASSGGVFNGGAFGNYDAYAPGVAYPLTTAPCATVTASAAPPSPQAQGTTVTITAVALGCTNPLYEFWIRAPGSATWQMAQGYSSSNTFTWTTGGINGVYNYSVWVRDNSSAGVHQFILSSYDAFFPGSATFNIT